MNGLEFHARFGRAWTFGEMIELETDLGELCGLLAAREHVARVLADPALRPTEAERQIYARRHAELAKAAARRAAK